jgi:hypothetical protein
MTLAASCQDKTAPTEVPLFSGSVTDPSGDTGGGGHDVTAIAVTVLASGTVRVDVTFAPGTLLAGDTDVILSIDTDQNAATGFQANPADAALIGMEYFVEAPSSRGSTDIRVFKAVSAIDIALVATSGLVVTYPQANVMHFEFPLSVIGNDDGKFALKAQTAVYVVQNGTSGRIDTAPNEGLPPLVTK